jgi:hypothetical protein
MMAKCGKQALDAPPITLLDYVVERLTPFTLLDRLELGVVALDGVSHRGSTFVEFL